MPSKVSSVEELLERAVSNREKSVDQRSHLALELIADTLIAFLVELQRPERDAVTSIP